MKGFYRLLNYDFGQMSKIMCGISLILIMAQNLLLSSCLKSNSQYKYIPYEKLIDMSGVTFVFYLCLALTAACCVYSIVANYIGSKSIYTLMTLPGMRRKVYFSKLTAGAAAFLMLLAAQFISVFIGFKLFSTQIVRYDSSGMVAEHPVNGLFLAFIRSDFLRILFPLSPESFISTAAIFISLLCGIYYVILCIQSKKYINISIAFVNFVAVLFVLNYRVNAFEGWKYHNLYIYSGLFIAASAYYIWQCINWTEKSKNLG